MDLLIYILGASFPFAVPLAFAGLGGVITERSGVTNIGLEGMMTLGAFVGAWIGYESSNPWLAFFCAGLAGLLLSSLHAVASVYLRADQIISGTAMNFLGPALAIFLSKLIYNSTSTPSIDIENKLPKLFSKSDFFLNNIIHQNISVYIIFLLVFLMWFFLFKTNLGLRLRGAGEHPEALDSLGINVFIIRFCAVLMSGFLAGLGGAVMTLDIGSLFRPGVISGQGFIALATVIFGRWHPFGMLLAGLFFGLSSSTSVIFANNPYISSEILSMLPYVATLFILIFTAKRNYAPQSVGVIFKKS